VTEILDAPDILDELEDCAIAEATCCCDSKYCGCRPTIALLNRAINEIKFLRAAGKQSTSGLPDGVTELPDGTIRIEMVLR